MSTNNRSRVKRSPKRGIYDRKEIYKILDQNFLCHVALIYENSPLNIPTMYGREDDHIFIHGASVSRLIQSLENGVDVCISIAQVNDLVLARSAFHHSMNYESVVIFGRATLVDEKLKNHALKVIYDHLIPGRWEEVRPPSDTELKATKVIKIEMVDVSAKSRTGGPIDDKEDYELPIWAGNIPYIHSFLQPQTDPLMQANLPIPESAAKKVAK